jgi:hypothetical protein
MYYNNGIMPIEYPPPERTGIPIVLPNQTPAVRHFIFFFISFTLAEIAFSSCYYFLTERIDATLLLGAILYLAVLSSAYLACRAEQYREKKQSLIDSLP